MNKSVEKFVEHRDPGAFRSLFLTFGPKVKAMLLRQGADKETAEDILQETMLTVWSKSHLFAQEKGTLSTWIYTIARNLRIDRIRRQIVWEQMQGELEKLNSPESAVDEAVAREEDRQYVQHALTALPAEQLQVIQLSYLDGLTQNEIAQRLKLPVGTVKSRMRLAFGKLRCSGEGGL